MRQAAIEAAVRGLLEGLGEDLGRAGLRETPRLVGEAAGRILSGYGKDPRALVDVIEGPDELIMLQGVPFFSVCEHHLLPFFGTADVALLPQGGRIAGLGSLADVVDAVARRLQIQERVTSEIADALEAALAPRGVYVRLKARQLCMQMLAGQYLGAESVTVAARGALREGPEAARLSMLLGAAR